MHQPVKPCTSVTKVKQLFDKAGSSFAFTPQECGRRIIEQVMIRYRDQFIQLWNSELNKRGEAGNNLRTYRLFKSRFQLEVTLSSQGGLALTKLIEGELSQASDRTGKVPQTMLHPTRT